MAEKQDEWAYWRAALAGTRMKVGTPQAGYYRLQHTTPLPDGSLWEPVGFWWATHPSTEKPFLRWQRTAPRYAQKPWHEIFEDQVADCWVRCSSYPIPLALYKAVRAGEPWPPIYTVPLPMEWARAGKLMTPQAAESILRDKSAVSGTKAKMAEIAGEAPPPKDSSEPTDGEPGVGHNSEAVDNRPRHEKYKELADEKWRDYQKWLKGIGGVIKTAAQADEANAWKNEFITLRTQGEHVRKKEKQPHLDAGRAVDEAFNPIIRECSTRENEVIKAQDVYLKAEREKAAAAARAEQERLDAERAKAAETGAPPPEPEQPREAAPPPRAGVVGRRTEYVQVPYIEIVDREKMIAAFMETAEFAEAAVAWATRVRKAPLEPVPGTVVKYREELKG